MATNNPCGGLTATGDVPDVDVKFGLLANNGGPTQTHALLAGSPAIDAVVGACSATDQRGFSRPVDGNGSGTAECDIGAFEFDAVQPPVLVTNRFSSVLSGQSTSTTPVAGGPAGVYSFTSRFCNTASDATMANVFSRTRELSAGKLLLSRTRDGAPTPGGVGSEQDFSDTFLTSGECVNVLYRIGLNARTPFSFRVDLLGNLVQ